MSRLRQAAPAGSQYITPEGARRLRLELELLWRDERPRVTQAVAAGGGQGGRFGDAEYTYGKGRRRLRGIAPRTPNTPTASAACGKSTAGYASCAGGSRAWWSSTSPPPTRRGCSSGRGGCLSAGTGRRHGT